MSIIGNLQTFVAGSSGVINTTDQIFRKSMDTVLNDLGRDIQVHLAPAKSPCPSSDCRFDSFYKKYVSANGGMCSACKGTGFYLEPRRTIYKANIRWDDKAFNESASSEEPVNMQLGRLGVNTVRTKTVAASFDHIKQSVGATIDGIDVELHNEPRYTAWGSVLYVVTYWKVVNR